MAKTVEELEVEHVEAELEPLLRRSVEVERSQQRSTAPSEAEAPARLPGRVSSYRFNYRSPERLSPEETRRRRFEGVLAEERARAQSASPTSSVSGQSRAQRDYMRSAAAAADARRFHPASGTQINPRTLFGTEAVTFVSNGMRRHFMSPLSAIPCIQRVVRREVMFARKKGGKGYRVPHVRKLLSNIGC